MYTNLWAIAVIRFGNAPKETFQGQLASTKLCTVTGGGGGRDMLHGQVTAVCPLCVLILTARFHCCISPPVSKT